MTTRHIPPGREDLYRRQEASDKKLERLYKALLAAERRRDDLVAALGWDDPLVDEADEEMARLLDEHNRAVAVNNRIFVERTAGLSWGIDHDPTAPVCPSCRGAGCQSCRGWGREYREPIPVWSDRDKTWVNPATGQTVDLLADQPAPMPSPTSKPTEVPDARDLRRGRWYDTNPITTNTNTGSAGGTGMASIDEVRAGLYAGNESANEGLGALQHAHTCCEQAQAIWMRATEGSGQADVSTANGLIAQAVASIEEVRQQVSAAISASEDVGNRL